MDQAVFPDKSHLPQDADLARALGQAKRHWDDLVAHARGASPTATPEWKYYGKKFGWTFVLRGKRHNLLYMKPVGKSFSTSFAFGEKAVQAALESDLPAKVIEMIRQSPKYPEGRAVRMAVTSAADAKVVKRLLSIKLDT